ncbi:MAG: histone deacetylase [Gracilibacteraceae bacterium]|jgi:acetoin utilization deacetylase AcuC-like enzyme|nr:histone deacetylase [Gracilibacteraceae bacterium]
MRKKAKAPEKVPDKTGILFFPAFDWSLGETHPEREERLLYTQEQMFEEGVLDLPQVRQFAPAVCSLNAVARAQAVLPEPGVHSLEAHLIAAGSALVLGEAWRRKEIANGFALVRPPGHHAGAVVWGNRGFCTLNSEAIVANDLRTRGVRRIAIVDTDVHHGDGTQDIFYHDPNVLFISLHQDGRTIYPGSGGVEEQGGPNAWGSCVNIPLLPGMGDEGFLYALENIVLPKIAAFEPDMIINAAGQDNHFTDPLAEMNVTAKGYGKITEVLRPDLAVLEGGYSIQGALPYVNMAIFLALCGADYSGVREYYAPSREEVKGAAVREYFRDLEEARKQVHHEWQRVTESFLPSPNWFYREVEFFYDTDDFMEKRREYIRPCRDCGGTVLMMTRNSMTLERGVIVRIPYGTCDACRLAAERIYDCFIDEDSPMNRVVLVDNGQ